MTRPAILDLDLVVVPRQATDEMLEPTGDSCSLSTLWDAMLSASPYHTAWDDVRKYVEGMEMRLEYAYAAKHRCNEAANRERHERIKAEARIAELEAALALSLNGNRGLPYSREYLGLFVREAWIRWAKTQPNPKPSWLVPYDELPEQDKEADRQIGEAVARWTLIGDAAAITKEPTP